MTITIRFYYGATIAVARTSVFALAVALIAAVIVGGNAPNVSLAIIAFALAGASSRHGVVSVGSCEPPFWLSGQAGDNATSDSHQSLDGTSAGRFTIT